MTILDTINGIRGHLTASLNDQGLPLPDDDAQWALISDALLRAFMAGASHALAEDSNHQLGQFSQASLARALVVEHGTGKAALDALYREHGITPASEA